MCKNKKDISAKAYQLSCNQLPCTLDQDNREAGFALEATPEGLNMSSHRCKPVGKEQGNEHDPEGVEHANRR